MLPATTLVVGYLLSVAGGAEDLSFPPGFKFGVASAGYQVEGAWNVSDKGESIWDRFTHKKPSPINDRSNGDVACDSYRLWKEDIRMVAEVGADFYRISVSWPRLLPNGFADHISEDGKNYYNNLINGLLEKGIEPIITLYHWDLPQNLQDLGGWTNPLVTDWFADYARVAYTLFGDRVKTWITINEAWVVCDVPYTMGIMAPGILSQVGAYLCNKNVLVAHAKAWRIYDKEFRPKYHGAVSFANHPLWMEAANEAEEPTAELVREYQSGRFSHAIYSKQGGWPPAVEKAIAEFSQKEGYPWSMLPAFTKEEIELVKGTYDFYAINFYNTRRVRRAREGEVLKPWPLGDLPLFNAKMDFDPEWPVIMDIYADYPEGLRKQLAWLKNHYGNIPFFITESGRATTGGLDDQERVDYYRRYLKQVLLSIKEDGVNVTGYTAWSIMDNFEWTAGYTGKYGLYEVDFSSPNRTRTARASARYYASVIKSRSLDVPFNYTSYVAPKSSKPQGDNSRYLVFGGLILVVIVGILAAIVGCKLRDRSKLKKKHRYAAVNTDSQNESHRNVQNGAHRIIQNGDHSDILNGTRNENGRSNGSNGVSEIRIPLAT